MSLQRLLIEAMADLGQRGYKMKWDYTGMKDRYGAKIYAGYILNCCKNIIEPDNGDSPVFLAGVYWDFDRQAYGLADDAGFICLLSEFEPKEVIIVGNIYDDSELLSNNRDFQ